MQSDLKSLQSQYNKNPSQVDNLQIEELKAQIKLVETDPKHEAHKVMEDGLKGRQHKIYKRAEASSIVGDTVGDPMKDTSGPSLNILIKLSSIISLVFGSVFVNSAYLASN
jgi:hypothetical protein